MVIKCKSPKNKREKTICQLLNSKNTIKVLDKKGNLIGLKIVKKRK